MIILSRYMLCIMYFKDFLFHILEGRVLSLLLYKSKNVKIHPFVPNKSLSLAFSILQLFIALNFYQNCISFVSFNFTSKRISLRLIKRIVKIYLYHPTSAFSCNIIFIRITPASYFLFLDLPEIIPFPVNCPVYIKIDPPALAEPSSNSEFLPSERNIPSKVISVITINYTFKGYN